ncbi:adenylate/guanylate cyclase domain-containing protein [Pseudomaricurvus sp. HS19]|uniref:adenylate/guanylate cyclase domain-containing protein n=1 Tax=Pseudomaricurvus sp. HS19 TaxID=2692626 RepID=UPI0013700833|nr:adenylate/guanylate cyclase domain-containing protein [Pseudomaricurvus sp. HS19]MYM62981.1 FHA domain-containing protein [Pseudomaricurvus sp. HS19]
MTPTSQTKAILFADISGSSGLYKALGNEGAKKKIDQTLRSMTEMCEHFDGVLVKTIGDEILVTFDSAMLATDCAQSLQQQAPQFAARLPLRIGIAYGEVLVDQSDVFGDVVNDAACLTRIARSGQVLISDTTAEAIGHNVRSDCQQFDQLHLKGDADCRTIYRLLWETVTQVQHATRVLTLDTPISHNGLLHITLRYGDDTIAIMPQQTPYVLGRDHNRANLCIRHPLASREHCEVVFRRGKFVLVDHSTNGTYITQPNQSEIYLRREELPLIGEGTIAFGQPAQQNASEVVHFSAKALDEAEAASEIA